MNMKEFIQKGMDAEMLGFTVGAKTSSYFCTPRGAIVLGWAGVDGIHFCTVKKFGEMVFSVSPMNAQNDYVHPLAKNFEDFLRLILAVGHTAAIEQVHLWSREQFECFVRENSPTEEAKAALARIAEAFSLSPMEKPYEYVKSIQDHFDYLAIPYKSDYEEWCPLPRKKPEWAVRFDGGLHREGEKRERAGREIPIGKRFSWAGRTWLVPAVYACASGLVADICTMIEPRDIREFSEKWLIDGEEAPMLSAEMRETMERENPMDIDFRVVARVNGKALPQKHGTGTAWLPASCRPAETVNDEEALLYLEHYGLDGEMGWIFRRLSFPWATVKKPTMSSLSLTFFMEKACYSGAHLTVSRAGETFTFAHPVSGEEHALTVLSYEKNELGDHLRDGEWERPQHFATVEYTLSPALSRADFYLTDCEESDQPRRKQPADNRFSPEVRGDFAILMIGGASGPTAILTTPSGKNNTCSAGAAASALHFEPREKTEFRTVFRVREWSDITISLIDKKEATSI